MLDSLILAASSVAVGNAVRRQSLSSCTPFESEIHAERAHRLILWRFWEPFVFLKHTDIESDTEVMVGVTAGSVGYLVAGLGPTLRIKLVLLGIRLQTADRLNCDAGCRSLVYKRARVRTNFREQRRDRFFTAIVHLSVSSANVGRRRSSCCWRLRHETIVNCLPRLRPRLSVYIDADCFLHCANNVCQVHGLVK